MDKTLFCGCLRMKYLLIFIALMLSGCEDRYRYKCQNPDYFHAEECQKPKCLFTQMCPEYLVAPILEKKVNDVQQPENKPNN
jgi:hypothetical protein